MRTTLDTSLTSTSGAFGLAPEVATTAVASQRSPWHSPVPYLFGGLAAMLGLIAFALLILACSYWKLSREQENQQDEDDLEKGEGANKMKYPPVYEEKIVVIMAGNDKPTFLATPALVFSKPKSINEDVVTHQVTKDGAQETASSTSVADEKSVNDDDETQH